MSLNGTIKEYSLGLNEQEAQMILFLLQEARIPSALGKMLAASVQTKLEEQLAE